MKKTHIFSLLLQQDNLHAVFMSSVLWAVLACHGTMSRKSASDSLKGFHALACVLPYCVCQLGQGGLWTGE